MTPDNQNTLCADCELALPTFGPGHCGATGYAILPNGNRICYPCADKREIAELKDRSRPFVAYVGSCHGKGCVPHQIQTWTGGKLMTIIEAKPCKLTRQSFTHDRNGYYSIHAVDVHGGHWHGRGSEGVAIKLRPCKS